MTRAPKAASGLATLALVVAAVGVGAGKPLSPARIANLTSEAADNLRIAVSNTEDAVRATEALATIEKNVQSQLATSRRLLETQLGIEESSKAGLDISRGVADRIGAVAGALEGLVGRLRDVGSLSSSVTGSAEAGEAAAEDLEAALDHLIARYEVAVRESRELNKKARAFEQVRP